MKAARRLPRLSDAARQDVRRILTWFESPRRRLAFLDSLEVARRRLMEFPEIGTRKGGAGERQWVAGGEFVICYRIAGDGRVDIARIYGPGERHSWEY